MDILAKIKKTEFKNPQLKELLIGHYNVASLPAKERRQQAAFNHIVVSYVQIFPEDAGTIRGLFDWAAIQEKSALGKGARPMVIRDDVFSDSRGDDLDYPKPCEDCPGNVKELMDQYADEEDSEPFKLPDELYDTDPEPQPVTKLSQVVNRESMNEFLGVGQRTPGEVIETIRSYFKTNEIAYDGKARSLKALLDEFYRLVVSPQ